MITYRSLKKLLGETSLERKCRYLFGAALLGLITGSFWLHAAKTRQLVRNQQVLGAQTLLSTFFLNRHLSLYHKQGESGGEDHGRPSALNEQAQKQSFADFAEALRLTESTDPGQPRWFLSLTADPQMDDADSNARRKFESGEEDDFSEFIEEPDGSRSLKYVAAIRATVDCLGCHQSANQYHAPEYTPNQFVAVATVTIPMARVDQELSVSNAVFVGSAIITTGLAMLAAYIIVRYIVVKPVLHLKDVSDAIAMGNLTQRAEITTGDEFEELSHAFNRMLRHMTTVNTELRTVNDNLDAKVDLLAQANMEMFNSNRLKNDFLATVSHELRTPLNSILGFSDILAGAVNLDERQHRYVDNIQSSGRSLMNQINDLLDLAKIESGQLEIQAGSLDLPELINHLVQQVTPLAEQKNINLRVTHAWPTLPKLHQDAGKVRQILTNLLSNAIKFTPEGGRVRVSSRQLKGKASANSTGSDQSSNIIVTDDLVEIAVEDTGIGIPMQQQEDVFEKFRQGATLPGQPDHSKREYEGTGLGLSIVRELTRLLGGDVSLESEFGKGSVFTVTIPMTVRPVEKKTEPTLDSPTTGLSRITSVNLMNPAS
ncbi:MAG: HAMP domain-containing histidine kinase [Fuerstiella sp.]|nr:HAMP domain-containing histidine kinase [Fuerstiella sp.]